MKVNCNMTLGSLDFKNHSIAEYNDELANLFITIFELYTISFGGRRYIKIIEQFGNERINNNSQIQINKYASGLSILNIKKDDDGDLEITFQNLSTPVSLKEPTIITEAVRFDEISHIIPRWTNIFLQNYNELMQKKQDYIEKSNECLKNLGFTGALFKQ